MPKNKNLYTFYEKNLKISNVYKRLKKSKLFENCTTSSNYHNKRLVKIASLCD